MMNAMAGLQAAHRQLTGSSQAAHRQLTGSSPKQPISAGKIPVPTSYNVCLSSGNSLMGRTTGMAMRGGGITTQYTKHHHTPHHQHTTHHTSLYTIFHTTYRSKDYKNTEPHSTLYTTHNSTAHHPTHYTTHNSTAHHPTHYTTHNTTAHHPTHYTTHHSTAHHPATNNIQINIEHPPLYIKEIHYSSGIFYNKTTAQRLSKRVTFSFVTYQCYCPCK